MNNNSHLKPLIKFKKKSGDFFYRLIKLIYLPCYLVEQAHSVLIDGGGS